MAGSRSNSTAASTSTTNKTEMTTLPSGASYPTFLEPLTKNELALLDTYERIKHYEKEAARLKAEEAKRRLEEANERYQAKVREREKAEGKGSDDDDHDDHDGDDHDDDHDDEKKNNSYANPSDDDDDNDSDEDEATIEARKKRAKEISKLRKEVNAANDAKARTEAERDVAKQKEEAMRRSLLGESAGEVARKRSIIGGYGDDDDSDENDSADGIMDHDGMHHLDIGPSIKKKRVEPSNPWDEKPKPSLIANMGGDTTPIHDFSKKLGMSKISLDGSVLYPTEGNNLPWEPPAQPSDFLDGSLELELPDFDSSAGSHSGNNTIAVKFHAPQDSKRFSINIAAPNHDHYNDILFHFNPRHFKKGGQLVINNRVESMWGNDLAVPLSTLPMMYGVESCTLIVQINEEGFDVFVQGQHCARLEHRTPLPKRKGPLFLQFPSSDDYGNPENWMVYRVWWGRKRSMADDLNGVAGVDLYSSVHPKKLFISGLHKLRSDPEVDLRKAELERAFRKYGGPSGAVLVSVQKNSTFAFVEVHSEQLADRALVEMARKYKVNKARRTKHEALMEERASKEGGVKESGVDWD
mmetsp:Transcript_11757/g.25267  ORF Transcript_11757/g.25267 Transcript_11757/m.25267 type:complete len:582 (+) Transcript_11757:120-1865(+)